MPLILCGMPIGNQEDISPRVLQALANADLIAAEDTRSAALFLKQHSISKKLISFYDHNETARAPQILEILQSGQTVALISEAGMPLISDPGYHLVKAARDTGVEIDVIPGPTAFVTALAASGLPTDSFIFCGFFKDKILDELKNDRRTLIFYEAPHRIVNTLEFIAELLPRRQCFVGRELTKKYQEHLSGTAREILQKLKTVKGEFVIVLSGNNEEISEIPPEALRLIEELKNAELSPTQIIGIIAKTFDLPKNKLKKFFYTNP